MVKLLMMGKIDFSPNYLGIVADLSQNQKQSVWLKQAASQEDKSLSK